MRIDQFRYAHRSFATTVEQKKEQKVQITMLRVLVISLCLAVQGCTYQSWYAGFQEQQRQQCYKNTMISSETQQCIDRVNNTTYDQYKVQREQAVK